MSPGSHIARGNRLSRCVKVLSARVRYRSGRLLLPGSRQPRNQWLRIFARSRAIDWLCSWHTRDSVMPSTSAISLRFMSFS